MSLLNISAVSIRIGGRPLLSDADLVVDPGRRIGLVGRNGAGKSTLLKAIAGDITVDGGQIRLAARAKLGRVKQEAPDGEQSLLDTVLEGDPERLALLAEVDAAAHTEIDPERLADVIDRLVAIEADSAPSRAAVILAGLGFDAATQQRPVNSFSGGWRMRVALATALFLVARTMAGEVPRRRLGRLARPRPARSLRRQHRPSRSRQDFRHPRRL
jgi:ATP-binding cassette subfamily F protein 3